MIYKHEIPILEFDDNPQAEIMPTHEDLGLVLPPRCVYGFLEEEVERYATYNGKEICLAQAPVGSAAAAQFMDWLIGYGVKQIISTGTCGVLVDMPENVFLIPTRALRDEGASYHYVAPSRYIDMNEKALGAIEKTLKQKKISYKEVMTWSTDGFYRETPDKISYRIEEGCSVVEMECAALAAVAQFRGAIWGLLLFTADSLADIDNYDQRDWGSEAFDKALELCLDIIVQM